jgi:hypothetical protein
MRSLLWMTCCVLAGAIVLAMATLLLTVTILGVCLHGFDDTWLRPALLASPFVGAALGGLTGRRHTHKHDGRPTDLALSIAALLGLGPLVLLAWRFSS